MKPVTFQPMMNNETKSTFVLKPCSSGWLRCQDCSVVSMVSSSSSVATLPTTFMTSLLSTHWRRSPKKRSRSSRMNWTIALNSSRSESASIACWTVGFGSGVIGCLYDYFFLAFFFGMRSILISISTYPPFPFFLPFPFPLWPQPFALLFIRLLAFFHSSLGHRDCDCLLAAFCQWCFLWTLGVATSMQSACFVLAHDL